ncbi:MAG TPA: hypothetical protein PKC73_01695 [Dermatophilaceae bacterium]|nr:hypothetical protein [Actinomycetales bacterium]HMT31584.1 hypothetical protein [Dermatophilaceae bacterium]HMT88325.1 hypothetical protein [Dermatophilaceae bacterium]
MKLLLQDRWKPLAAVVASFVLLVGVARCGSGMAVYDPESASMTGATATADPTGTAAASPSATATASASASAPTDSASVTPTPGSAETPDRAKEIATTLLGQYSAAALVAGKDGDTQRAAILSGRALDAANARSALASTLSADQKADLTLRPDSIKVLAISRGPEYPRTIAVTATTAQSASPVLVLLQAPDTAAGYRIVSQATLVPGAPTVQFEALSAGAAVATDGSGLAMGVGDVASAYAASVAFPRPAADARFTADTFAAELLKNAQAQAGTLSRSGTLAQVHAALATPSALRLSAGRGALVFGILDRTDTLTETTTNALTPSREFTILSGKTLIDKKAVLKSAEFLVWYVPESGKVALLAAADQLVGASGS